uniref:Uncharacterized protein n=1 Tax=Glossina palpalis gambiensis TaxID=67801 RepID=A0A1B0BUJ0_9MUSC
MPLKIISYVKRFVDYANHTTINQIFVMQCALSCGCYQTKNEGKVPHIPIKSVGIWRTIDPCSVDNCMKRKESFYFVNTTEIIGDRWISFTLPPKDEIIVEAPKIVVTASSKGFEYVQVRKMLRRALRDFWTLLSSLQIEFFISTPITEACGYTRQRIDLSTLFSPSLLKIEELGKNIENTGNLPASFPVPRQFSGCNRHFQKSQHTALIHSTCDNIDAENNS